MTRDARFSICEFTIPNTSFEEDLSLIAAAGISGISVCESKLRPTEDAQQLAAFRSSGLQAAVCIPSNVSPLPAEPFFAGPVDPAARVSLMCESLTRLARFDPACVLVLTGSGDALQGAMARQIAIEGLREAARFARELGITLAVEPIRHDFRTRLSLVSTLPETLDLIEEVGASNVKVAYDVYHLWDTKDILALTRSHAKEIAGVHVCDWRDPMRGDSDRFLPGDGVIELPAFFEALDAGGYNGWYDLEVFSDARYPDSPWRLPLEEIIEHGREGFWKAWTARGSARAAR